jgi:Stage II sporulation protein E (SpoIIE)
VLSQKGSQIVSLEPGDVLVAFTDGISEAMNRDDEEWGEERLIETVRALERLPAAQMIAHITAGTDRFVAGAPQHDDMTVVVLRLRIVLRKTFTTKVWRYCPPVGARAVYVLLSPFRLFVIVNVRFSEAEIFVQPAGPM